ncbi:MAG: hypothetical protein WC707_05550 [Candidatus Babeliaceae bacterium]|jgi:hypothetical protein
MKKILLLSCLALYISAEEDSNTVDQLLQSTNPGTTENTAESAFQTAPVKKPKKLSPFEQIDPTDFPYVWRYANDIEEKPQAIPEPTDQDSSQPIIQAVPKKRTPNKVEIIKITNHALCQSIAEKAQDKDGKLDREQLETVKASAHGTALEKPERTWGQFFSWDRATYSDKDLRDQNDRAMAIYNCAEIYLYHRSFLEDQEFLNNFLKKEPKEPKESHDTAQ